MTEPARIALVIGGTHGLGFETARQLAQRGMTVIITSPDGLVGKAAADKLQSEGLTVRFQLLDTQRDEAVIRLRQWLVANTGGLDILVNHAESHDEAPDNSILGVELERLREGLEANTFNALRLARELIPVMQDNGRGRIVNVAASTARLNRMDQGWPVYRLSKAALHALTAMMGAELADSGVRVNAVDPDAGITSQASEDDGDPVVRAAANIVAATLIPDDGPNGCLLHDGAVVDR